jgi:hypothetical protein
MNYEEILQGRAAAVKESLKTLGDEEVKALGERLFPYADDPWREQFFAFLAEHPGATFYHATIPGGIEILYCHSENRGIWFAPRQGVGLLQEKGLQALAGIVSGAD